MDATFVPHLLTGSYIPHPCGFTTAAWVEDSPKQTRKAEQLCMGLCPLI